MRLTSFHVQGFKSLVDVNLQDLQQINVFHGPNNVGKSNIVQAMELFFRLLTPESLRRFDPVDMGAPHARMLNVFRPGRIEMEVRLDLGTGATGLTGATVRRQILPEAGHLRVQPVSVALAEYGVEGRPLVGGQVRRRADEIEAELWPPSASGQPTRTPFALVDSRRRGDGMSGGDRIVPQSLREALYFAKEDTDLGVRRRWELFRQTFSDLGPPLGPVELETAVHRPEKSADLICIVNGASVLLDDLGTGVQQLIALVGHLLTTDARIVAIEEPELNLSYPLQKVLRGMLERVVRDEAGPDQLFITSHSPAFDGEGNFHRVWMENHETKVERASVTRRWAETGWPTDTELEDADRPPPGALGGYVSSDGLVELPDDVRADMGLQHGDHVFFAKDDDGYWKLVGPREWDSLMEGLPDE